MHIKLPEKMDRVLQYLKLKIFPNTLFFRTMLMIFIPLILVQVCLLYTSDAADD